MSDFLETPLDPFPPRHIGPDPPSVAAMLGALGFERMEDFITAVVPESIRRRQPLELGPMRGEREVLRDLRQIARRNEVYLSLIGLGYHNTVTPPVIQRNLLENPGWYTQYTPYQAEIAQGRLEALLNFQTMVVELTGLPLANASLLDEATAAAEAMGMCWSHARGKKKAFFAADHCHPQTLAVVATRARAQGFELHVGDPETVDLAALDLFGVLVQYPDTGGRILDFAPLAQRVRDSGAALVCATDLLALTLLRPPGEFGADIAVGSTQRFGVPLGFGGPHAGFLAASHDHERALPGRIVGVSKDAAGNQALRLARQTREQHIRREKATSNICTAQVLPAVLASMYAVYHGPAGLLRIAGRIRDATRKLAAGLRELGLPPEEGEFFDTLRVRPEGGAEPFLAAALARGINLRDHGDGSIGITLDETVEPADLEALIDALAEPAGRPAPDSLAELGGGDDAYPTPFGRSGEFLGQDVFNRIGSEHEMLRYLFQLQERDLSLAHSMIPLGSCTMKLNATAEMMPITWPELADLHPFAPAAQTAGYAQIIGDLERWLGAITGLEAVSLQPNAGSQGELSGLLVIRAYHQSRGEPHRDICLIPTSAHGTNPASAVMAGMKVVAVDCDEAGNIDLADLAAKARQHGERLGALMITYPSTHGVFEEGILEFCRVIHEQGGQVYMDGANMNAQVGLCLPGELGVDVCHLNLHKTFCIPHGGGGPGMGPICAAEHLAPFLPRHPLAADGESEHAVGAVAAAPFGSPGILPISWMYIAMMGAEGLTDASRVAILNANYMAKRLSAHFAVLYTGRNGFVAHEFIIDLRELRKTTGVTVDDIAKRLMDYGFHAPTMSWPVAGTMMIEPTESESKEELDRYCEAMIAIRREIQRIEAGEDDRENNPLKNAPHTLSELLAESWDRPYSRERAAYPLPWLRERKFWPTVSRIDNAWGDRHLACTCDSVESYALEEQTPEAERPAPVGKAMPRPG